MRVLGEDSPSKNGNKNRTRLVRRYAADRRGSTAVEFVLLALPFMLLVFAILESCISFAGQQLLANATDDVARQIRTGQLKGAEITETKLKESICAKLSIIVADGCPGLEVDLREYDTFEKAAAAGFAIQNGDIVLLRNGVSDGTFDVDPGPSMSKNMLRVFYRWPVITDFMSKAMSNLDDGKALHFASATWQNEPFDD